MKSLYTSPAHKEEIMRLYHEKLKSLPVNYSQQKIDTSFGETHIIVSGDRKNPPAVIVPGANAGAPVALETLSGLTERFCLYLVDVIGQPALSAETRPSMKDDSYGKWLNEVILKLGLSEVTLIGISFGGFISLKTAVYDQSRISRLFLIVPVGLINSNPLAAIFGIFLLLYMLFKKEKFLYKFLDALFTEKDPYAVKFLGQVFLYFNQDFSSIPLITKEEGCKISVPVHIVAGEKDNFFPGDKLLKQAKRIFPSLSGTLLLPNAKHVPSPDQNRKVESFIFSNTLQSVVNET